MSLMKEHLIFRSNLKYLPQDISAFLKVNYGQATEPREITESLPKRGMCRSCVLEKKISSASMKCRGCQSFTCKNHSTVQVICHKSKNKDKDFDE